MSCSRDELICEMFRAGRTLTEIGRCFGVSRQRIHQITSYRHGLAKEEGGRAIKAEVNRARARARRDAKSLAKRGCTFEQWQHLRELSRAAVRSGKGKCQAPLGAFRTQRNHARRRGIPWRLTLWQWWSVWDASGHWHERGRGQGFVMCRIADEGGYELGNVFIAPAVENNSDGNKRRGGNAYRPKLSQVRQALELARAAA